jgi:hypothetical protein
VNQASHPLCRKLLLWLGVSFIGFCLPQGCVPVATGVITYTVAVSEQEHSAYTDYILITQQKNRERAKAGEEPLPIMKRDDWLKEIHRPQMAYSDFVDQYLRTNKTAAPVSSYEEWKGTEYPKILAQKEEAYQKAINQANLHR